MNRSADLRAWLPAYIFAVLCWGSSFYFIELAIADFPPAYVAFGRVSVGAALLVVTALLTRQRIALTWRKIGGIAAMSVGMSTFALVLFPLAQQELTSIVASLVNAGTPLWTAFFVALLIPSERANAIQIAGLLVGAVGIFVLVGGWRVDEIPVVATLMVVGATMLYGIGSTIQRRFVVPLVKQDSALALVATQLTISAGILAPLLLFSPTPAPGAFGWDSSSMWGLIGLGVLGTSFVYVAFSIVVRNVGATIATSVTFLAPVVATTLGVLLLGESVYWYEVIGALLVIGGVWLAQRKRASAVVAEVASDGEPVHSPAPVLPAQVGDDEEPGAAPGPTAT